MAAWHGKRASGGSFGLWDSAYIKTEESLVANGPMLVPHFGLLVCLLSSGVQAAVFVWSLIVPVCSTEVNLSSLGHLSLLEESPS